jgi:hypothetical protein
VSALAGIDAGLKERENDPPAGKLLRGYLAHWRTGDGNRDPSQGKAGPGFVRSRGRAGDRPGGTEQLTVQWVSRHAPTAVSSSIERRRAGRCKPHPIDTNLHAT